MGGSRPGFPNQPHAVLAQRHLVGAYSRRLGRASDFQIKDKLIGSGHGTARYLTPGADSVPDDLADLHLSPGFSFVPCAFALHPERTTERFHEVPEQPILGPSLRSNPQSFRGLSDEQDPDHRGRCINR